MVDAADLKSVACNGRVGSTPSQATNIWSVNGKEKKEQI